MPINPSIIGNVMAPQAVQLPDVNAMMQTQQRGLENVYKFEAARKEEKRTLAKEQEDAAVKALLPAYAYGLKNPTDVDGMLALVPPNMRENVLPYIDQIRGQSPDQVVAALTGSLVTSDAGRAFLENEARMRTAGIQQGQLDVSREDIKLRRQKQALDAQGQGAWELKEGIDENGVPIFVWTNPRTRQIVKADITGGVPAVTPSAVPGPTPIPAPDVVTPRQPAPNAPEAVPPAAAGQLAAEFRPKPKVEKAGELKEQEAKSLDLAAQMSQANKITDELDAKGVKTTDALVSFTEALFAALPDAAGRNLADQVRKAAENLLPSLSADEQRLARAQIQFVDAVLRSRSGAEIKTSEFPSMYQVFFPSEADENVPEIVADKKIARQLAVDTMRAKAGTLGAETLDKILRENGVLPPAATPLTPGATLEGFEYQGVRK